MPRSTEAPTGFTSADGVKAVVFFQDLAFRNGTYLLELRYQLLDHKVGILGLQLLFLLLQFGLKLVFLLLQ